jgi:hypothetical protein
MRSQKMLIILLCLALTLVSVSSLEAQTRRTRPFRYRRPPNLPVNSPRDTGLANQQSGGLSTCDNDYYTQVYFYEYQAIAGYGFPPNDYVLALATAAYPAADSEYIIFWLLANEDGEVIITDLEFIYAEGMDPSSTILVASDGYYAGMCAQQAVNMYADARALYNEFYNSSPPESYEFLDVGAESLSVDNVLVAVAAQGESPFGIAQGTIYGITDNFNLLWYRHDGWSDGSVSWALDHGLQVGNGWNFKEVFSGDDGVIYAITESGDLLWYRHYGWSDGSVNWDANGGTQIGNGWNFREVFSGDDGVIYAITESGDLLWYRHYGWSDGSVNWDANGGTQIGNGWNFKEVFAAG